MHPAAMDIAIDGPYGRSLDYSEHETVVLVAGILTLSLPSSTSSSKQLLSQSTYLTPLHWK